MLNQTQAPPFLDGLYRKLVENGIGYFFPSARLEAITTGRSEGTQRITQNHDSSALSLNWLGSQYILENGKPFSDSELKLLKSIGAVLDCRYQMLFDATLVEQQFDLFRGLPEDRFVSAYVDSRPYAGEVWKGPDRVEDAIEVLRTTSLSTYENRRISTGTLLFGTRPVPSSDRYRTHSRATLCGGHVCMILTPNGEMKILANGVQVFRFLDGRWRLTDAEQKYDMWSRAIGDCELAERLFVAALNLAEDRRGGLLVVLEDPRAVAELVSRTDLLSSLPDHEAQFISGSKDQLHYLLHQKRVLELPTAVLETVARIDGGIVLDRDSNLLAFGAILRHQDLTDFHPENIEGGRTTAAIAASRLGHVLKVSEDGLISFFQNGQCIWDM